MNYKLFQVACYLTIITCVACTPPELNNWEVRVPSIGSTSSPKAADLNRDGIKDIVIGGGGKEFEYTQHGVLAINGSDGNIMWSVPARNQVVGTPVFHHINEDDILDIYISGRSAILYAIDGADGSLIWEYQSDDPSLDLINDTTLLNFYTPVVIEDVDLDGHGDLLCAFGGFIKAEPDDTDRPSGMLKIISGATGAELLNFNMPDQKETYFAPLLHYNTTERDDAYVIFGSGGETINGHLYGMPLSDLLDQDISSLKTISDGGEKGFIAAPILVDIDGDTIEDIVISKVNGTLAAYNGADFGLMWQMDPGASFEVYTTPAAGLYNSDDIPDIYTSMGHGAWPSSDFVLHHVVDGSNGAVLFRDTLGLFQYASPVSYDLNGDGKTAFILCVNEHNQLKEYRSTAKFYTTQMVILEDGSFQAFLPRHLGTNLGSTPLITDLDDDGMLDMVTCLMEDGNSFYTFKNILLQRTELNITVRSNIQ